MLMTAATAFRLGPQLGMLSCFSNQLRGKLAQQSRAAARLELELLTKDAEHMEQLIVREQEVAQQVSALRIMLVPEIARGMMCMWSK